MDKFDFLLGDHMLDANNDTFEPTTILAIPARDSTPSQWDSIPPDGIPKDYEYQMWGPAYWCVIA